MAIPIAGYVAAGTSLIPAFVGVARYKRLNKAMKLFTMFSVMGCLTVATEFILGMLKINNHFLQDVYYLLGVPLLGLSYYWSVSGKVVRRFILSCVLVFVPLWTIDEIFFAEPRQLNDPLAMVSSVFLILMSIFALHALVTTASFNLTMESGFWIFTATILYASGTFMVLGLSNRLLELGVTYFVIAWYINWILYVLSMLMYAKGLLCKSQV
jgi:hypothetical protein